jgi:hypothetical protein
VEENHYALSDDATWRVRKWLVQSAVAGFGGSGVDRAVRVCAIDTAIASGVSSPANIGHGITETSSRNTNLMQRLIAKGKAAAIDLSLPRAYIVQEWRTGA